MSELEFGEYCRGDGGLLYYHNGQETPDNEEEIADGVGYGVADCGEGAANGVLYGPE